MVHLQDRGAVNSWFWVDQSRRGGRSGHKKPQHVPPLNLQVFEWLGKQRLEVTPTAYMKCICTHYSGLRAATNTRGLTLAVVSGRMCMCSCMISPTPVTKGLFAQINSLLVWYLTLSSPESTWTHAAKSARDTQIPASCGNARQAPCHSKTCLSLWEVIKPCICRAGMSSTLIVFAIQMYSRQRVAEEQACCRLDAVTATLAANPCTHATGNVLLPRHRPWIKAGSYRHVQHTNKGRAINIESDTSCSPLWGADEAEPPRSA